MNNDTHTRTNAAFDGSVIVDLAGEIYEGMPVYPGNQRTAIYEVETHEDGPSLYGPGAFTEATLGLVMSDHGPTHTDSLHHLDPDSDVTIDRMSLSRFLTPGVCLDVSFIRDPEDYLGPDDLASAAAEADLEIQDGDTVLLYTGHRERNWGTDEWLFAYGGLSRAGAEWLADRGVVNVGVDAPSIDSSREMDRRGVEPDDYPAHRVCQEQAMVNTENMQNLGVLAGTRFTYIGLPLKIRDGTASPVRAVAIVEEDQLEE